MNRLSTFGSDPREQAEAFAFVGFRSRADALENFPDEPSFFGE